jgi:hypothetical protein
LDLRPFPRREPRRAVKRSITVIAGPAFPVKLPKPLFATDLRWQRSSIP